MNDIERKLVTIARLALEALDSEVAPPTATEPARQSPASAPRRKPDRKSGHGRRQMICQDCNRGFLLAGVLLDATCPSCKSIHIKPRHPD